MTTEVTGRDESAGKSSGEDCAPRAISSAPSAATIAPLSVHRPGLGTRNRMPAASQRSAARARSREFAATPPPMIRWSTPCARQAPTALRVSTSTTASWNEAATSATGTLSPVTARVQNNGQACVAAKRFIVVRERAGEFIERFTQAMAAVPMGDPMEPETVLGPLATKAHLELLSDQVASSTREGAIVRTGGVAAEGTGYYYPATVLTNVPEHSRAGCEELFGPVAVVHEVQDLDAAIKLANATPWGLGASIWAEDEKEIDVAIADVNVGMVFANAIVASLVELPFGGAKNSP